jgi:hypothetical protein
MPYNASWYVENRVLLLEVFGDLTLDELQHVVDMLSGKVETEGPIHFITDTRNIKHFPTNPAHLANAFRGYKGTTTTGWNLIISANVVANFAMVLIGKISDLKYKTFTTLEDALQFLGEIDTTVEPLIKERQLRAVNE